MNIQRYLLCAAALAALASAQEPGQRTFESPGQAANALVQAVQGNNEPALEAILGKGMLSTDKEEARLERHSFAEKYNQMHRLIQEQDGAMILFVGAENWPFPVPLVSNQGKWFFDSQAGKEEIQYRRVGEDEITAQEVCDRFAAEKKREVKKASTGDEIAQLADKLAASAPGAEESFSGYHFRVVGNGNIALIAYPADYRSSGITTVLVTNDGALYEKDLGNDTAKLATQIKERPRSGWRAVQEK